ncbi:alkaline phosphatase PhoX [Desulfogranum marinum]|uniref:PhoX family protein n=1 Tax=Desulfogranum marinum TaxID=453220 RepID=UPI0029C62363|nr:alkaline phosphatase PhoX [Desulfogranum marinum]
MKKRISAAVCFGAMVMAATSTLAGETSKAQPAEVAFQGVTFPVTDEQKRQVLASSAVTVNGKDYPIGYNVILRSGDKVGDGTFGLLMDKNGKPVRNKDGSQHISVDNDFSSLLPIGNKLFAVSHFESRPGAMYVTELSQDKTTGKLTALSTKNIDFSAYGGLWVPCAGSVTPWNTHLGSEEYPNNARATESAASMAEIEDYDKPMARYFGVDPYAESTTVDTFRSVFQPYRYGYPVEVSVKENGSATPVKHFSMGRVAVELAYVMPDNKTTYISDDGTNVGFFMFVADKAKDLSAGNLYAAKWNQVHNGSGGYAELDWIDLGHANNQEIQDAIESGITFSDIFDVSSPKEDGSCEAGFTSINTTTGHECLQLKPGKERIASRLETRRYAAMKGATTEFRKEEGITFNPATSTLYVAMSEIAKGMEDNAKQDKGGPNNIRLPKNKCGVVYGLTIGADKKIGSEYVAKNMYGVVNGIMRTYPKDSDYANNTCDINGISNPDNVTYMTGTNILIIGEDTGSGHQNDVIWAYDTATQSLTRIQTTPYGSETTSPYYYSNINGHAYLMSVIQHPYGESDKDKLKDPAEASAYTGYIGPLPVVN